MIDQINTENYKEKFIEDMNACGALKFGEFKTKSGRLSPYFINIGAFNTGRLIYRLGAYYAACIIANITKGVLPSKIDILFGSAYKGIPLAAVTSAVLSNEYCRETGFAFNRKELKEHGEGGMIIGQAPCDGDNILVLDDVITAGTAIRENIPVIQSAASVNIIGTVISVDRMEKGRGELTAVDELRLEFGIEVFSIVNIRDILFYADSEYKPAIEKYMAEYCL